jgi:hypothetical protein
VETAIEEADGAADFLSKDLVAALKEVKNENLMAGFDAANRQAISELRAFAAYLKEQKLPKATAPYALGRAKYRKLLEYGEMVMQSPEQLLEVGMRELQRKQQVFGEAARVIDPAKPPIEVFRAIQKDHPTEQSLIPDTARDLDMIRQFVIDRGIITHSLAGPREAWRRHRNSCAPPASLQWTHRGHLRPRPLRLITTSRRWNLIGRPSKKRSG